MEKEWGKCAPKARDPYLTLVKNLKEPLHVREFFENKIF